MEIEDKLGEHLEMGEDAKGQKCTNLLKVPPIICTPCIYIWCSDMDNAKTIHGEAPNNSKTDGTPNEDLLEILPDD